MADEAGGSLLVLLLETHPAAWPALAAPSPDGGPGLAPAALVAQVGAFLGAYELEAEANEVVVLAVHGGSCPLLYQSPSRRDPTDVKPDPGGDDDPTIADALAASVAALASADAARGGDTPPPLPALAAALATALCIVGRETGASAVAGGTAGEGGADEAAAAAATAAATTPHRRAAAPPRVLVLAASAPATSGDAYVPVMNAVFAAQRLGVPIDVCVVGPGGPGVLAAAPHLTHGVLHTPRSKAALLPHLLSVFAPSATTRTALALPRAPGVDLGASCFCHAQRVDVGHVCSVCLSIWCGSVPTCGTCGADFGGGGPAPGSKRAADG